MENSQFDWIATLLYLSMLMSLVAIGIFLRYSIFKPIFSKTYKKSSTHNFFIWGLFFSSVLLLRGAMVWFSAISSKPEEFELNRFEMFLYSIIHSIQMISMNEDYTKFITEAKKMFRFLFVQETLIQTIFTCYVALLCLIASIIGCYIVLKILTNIFPYIKLFLSFWRKIYYFSKLTPASLALAKSIRSKETSSFLKRIFPKSAIVFADAYIDDEEEKGSELLIEAKWLGAICLKDDIAHVMKGSIRKRTFFLIDEANIENLKAFIDLASSRNEKYIKKSEIYLFTNDDAYVQVKDRVFDLLKNDSKLKQDELPKLVPIKMYRNLISNLLIDVPLYEPLIKYKPLIKNSDQDLVVTILGIGKIGREMFLSTYWFGQMLNCNLKINIVSQESEDEFWNKIDYINPEIRHTTIENHRVLQVNSNEDFEKPYCDLKYFQCDVKSSEFIKYLSGENDDILKTNYFLVSLGTDEMNISVANTVCKYVGLHHIKEARLKKARQTMNEIPETNDIDPMNTIIAYVVYDSKLSKILNKNKEIKFVNDEKIDVYMQAIGSLDDVYSVENVFMDDHKKETEKINSNHNNNSTNEINEYEYWASLARELHRRYKCYSIGIINNSLFNPSLCGREEYYNEVLEAYETICKELCKNKCKVLINKLSWLENRRWNAFTRVNGFRYTGDYKVYKEKEEDYKHISLKLHPCLVECDQNVRKVVCDEEGNVTQHDNGIQLDQLDQLSKKMNKDFKLNNCPAFEFVGCDKCEISKQETQSGNG